MSKRLHGSLRGNDRSSASLVYGLYLLGLVNGLTILVGLGIAYLSLRDADATLKSHHILQIRTVWIAAFWFLIGGGLISFAVTTSLGALGDSVILLGWLVCGSTWLWFAVRSVAGVLYLVRGQPYPRPRSWLI